ncbi:hypothetical protein PM082_019520 [Marasmius tenuissimus]|nr:hypothetical protein PM082_019520 [Marasmius tenuissimus]
MADIPYHNVGVVNDKDILLSVGPSHGPSSQGIDSTPHEDLVVNCAPYLASPGGKLTIRLVNTGDNRVEQVQVNTQYERSPGPTGLKREDAGEETLVDREADEVDSEADSEVGTVNSDCFDGKDAKERRMKKIHYKCGMRTYDPEKDRRRRSSKRLGLWFSQKHPHLYDQNGQLNHAQARKEGHGSYLPKYRTRKRRKTRQPPEAVQKPALGLSPHSHRHNQQPKRENMDIVPDSEEER